MRIFTAVILLLLTSPALADDKPAPPPAAIAAAQPAFVPFTVTEADWKDLQNWLSEQPYKFTQPMLGWLSALELRAQAEAASKAAPPAKK